MKPPALPLAVATFVAVTITSKQLYSAQLDTNFSPQIAGTVHALAVDSAGNIFVGGEFHQANGSPRANFAKFTDDGSLDINFTVQADAAVLAVSIGNNDSVLLGGAFNTPSRHLARVLPNGEIAQLQLGASTSSRVNCVASASDGSIVFGGPFRRLDGANAVYAGRISPSGAIDPTFNSGLFSTMSIEAGAHAIAVQPDGKTIVGGNFCTDDGFVYLVRLNADGSVDTSFNGNHGPILYPKAILVLEDGKILVAGVSSSDGEGFVRRLTADGTVDTTFTPPAFNGAVEAIALDEAGGVVVGGSFTGGLTRLNPDGIPDATWNIATDGVVKALALDGDGAVLIGGAFSTVDTRSAKGLARIRLGSGTQEIFATKDNDNFHACIDGEVGLSYEIQASSDLKTWSAIGIVVATEAGIEIKDSDTSGAQRFYRARLLN